MNLSYYFIVLAIFLYTICILIIYNVYIPFIGKGASDLLLGQNTVVPIIVAYPEDRTSSDIN